MNDLVSRQAAIEAIKELESSEDFSFNNALICAMNNIAELPPAADVRPVVCGRWKDAIQSCHDSPHVKCSVCGEYYWSYFKKFNYCPKCGADMKGEP